MKPEIIQLEKKILIGKSMPMSIAENKTGRLWEQFMPLRKAIRHTVSSDLFSIQHYPNGYFNDFTPTKEFTKWAAVEVSETNAIPEGMEQFTIPTGIYAVFQYHGHPDSAAGFFQHIFTSWLPFAPYQLDDRPHFEILGEKYKNEDPDSQEEIWIPIMPKT